MVYHLVLDTSIIWFFMQDPKKITVEVPEDLLRTAQVQTGKGISETVRRALELLAAAQSYKDLREMKGKIKFSKTYKEQKHD
jgi:Arc/MetJ-type ribon-helix-helix transcriptional regulator